MLKKNLFLLLFFIPLFQFAQDFSALWQGHFSYYNIKDVVKGNNKIYAASENAIFSFDIQTKEIDQISTINGLSGEPISTIYYSEFYELLVVGYETGLIEIVFDNADNILTIVDIVDKPTIQGPDKRINHFNAYDNLLYISTNYGISVFNLERLEFGDTYFIGNVGSQIQVKQTTIINDFIYAACFDGGGVKKAPLSSPNLIAYQNWQTIAGGDYMAVENNLNTLYALRVDNRIYSILNDGFTELFLYNENPVEMTSIDGSLIVTTTNNVYVYDSNFNITSQASVNQDFNTNFSSAMVDSEYIYIGTKDYGVLKTQISNPVAFEEVHPECPLLNNPFSIKAYNRDVWVTFGEYSVIYNPYPLNDRGFSCLKGNKWINKPFENVLGAKCLNGISINPFNTNQVFISSFFSGLLEVNNGLPTILYDETNSELQSLVLPSDPNYKDIRLGETAFDNQGLLWTTTCFSNNPLKSYNPLENKWQSYSFASIGANNFSNGISFSEIVIDPLTNTKFIASAPKGVIGFNENNGSQQLRFVSEGSGNLPTKFVRSIALDRSNQLWIGTHSGLRVLYNASEFFTSNLRAEEIIILEDGVAKELLAEQFISDIKVDGSNNKWIGTTGSGVFYLSSDGQKTIFHFTTRNSPLPSNNVNDIAIDDSTGIVYIATSNGLVSFLAGGTNPVKNLESAHAYPNPVRPNFDIVEKKVKIRGVSENVNIKITDVEGNLVAEAQSRINQRYGGYNFEIDGGTAFWNGKNLANNVVASGVYLVMIYDLDTLESRVLKLMVIR